MAKPLQTDKDNFDSLLDRIGILREELISIEQSLTRMRAAQEPADRELKPSR
jgi:hypothetical protein